MFEKVAVVGAGRTGVATALAVASLGHEVVCTDVDAERVEQLARGVSPFEEADLEQHLQRELAAGRLSFLVSAGSAVGDAGVVFVCVPTPSLDDGTSDLSYLDASVSELAGVLQRGSVVVVKSTVPVGTNAALAERLRNTGVHVVSNPEFLREGAVVNDTLHPSRVVIGGDDEGAVARVAAIFEPLGAPLVRTSLESAELTKYAANCYLAVRYSFVNELATMAEAVGADVGDVLDAMAFDNRIGSAALKPGPAWGGPCLPKDSRALLRQAEVAGAELQVLKAAVSSNHQRPDQAADHVRRLCGGSLVGKRLALWGLAFKAGTDDARDSPAMAVAEALVRAGASCSAYDPAAPADVRSDGVDRAATPIAACEGAVLLVILTDWPEFSEVDLSEVARTLEGDAVVDTRGVLDRKSVESAGLRPMPVGRLGQGARPLFPQAI